MATNEQLTAALQVVVNVARCIALKRALAEADSDPSLNFWRVVHGNLLDVAVLDWCKLFGSDPDGHFKFLHPWPGQIPPGQDSAECLSVG